MDSYIEEHSLAILLPLPCAPGHQRAVDRREKDFRGIALS